MKLGLLQVIVGMIGWWRDVINESFQYHSVVVQRGLRLGFILFIVSEVMFFFGFF
jgi:heme/copper-type cytochrome/quinol oxidase subunit 3